MIASDILTFKIYLRLFGILKTYFMNIHADIKDLKPDQKNIDRSWICLKSNVIMKSYDI